MARLAASAWLKLVAPQHRTRIMGSPPAPGDAPDRDVRGMWQVCNMPGPYWRAVARHVEINPVAAVFTR